MPCFILLTLAHTLGLLGLLGPPERIFVNRASIITVRASLPADPERPDARSLIRLSGPSVIYVVEVPPEVIGASCVAPQSR